MNEFLDLAIAPDPSYIEYLERELLADMGWAVPPPSRHRRAARRRRAAAVASAILLVAALIAVAIVFSRGDDGPEPPVTTVQQPTTSLSSTTSTSTSTPSPTTVSTTVPTTAGAATEPSVAMPQLRPLTGGTVYDVARGVIGRPLQFTSPQDGLFGFSVNGFFALARDKAWSDIMLSVSDLDQALVLADPLADLIALDTNQKVTDASVAVPDDYLAYFATLPAVTVGEIEETTFLGYPARSMDFEFGPVEGGHPCFSDLGNCVSALWFPVGASAPYFEGDAGTLYDVEIDGRHVLVELQGDHSDEAAASVLIGD